MKDLPDDQLPQIEAVMDVPPIDFNAHDLIQRGQYMQDCCNPRRPDCYTGGIPVPFGRMLVKNDQGYELVDEITRR